MVYNVSVQKPKFTVKDCTPKMRKNQLFLPINLENLERIIEVKEQADKENRSVNNMIEVMIDEYLKNCKK